MRALSAGTALLIICADLGGAQESLLPSTSWGAVPIVSVWHFGTPIAQSAGAITDVQQVAIPLRIRTSFGEQWTLDVSGASAASTVKVQNQGATSTLSLNGLTDVKVRLSGALADDRMLVTAGVNLPTGTTGLSADQTSVLQAVGAPALRMPVAALGIGPGVTLGFAAARESGPWAVALGASVEARSEYTPIELALASGKSLTKITPGTALHLTLGGDRTIGQNQLALLVVADAYDKDQVTTDATGGSTPGPTTSSYTLGPQLTALAHVDFAATVWREASADVSLKYRTAYTDAAGTSVSGSNGSYIDASWNGVRGGATGRGLILGFDGRYQSGLSFTDALVGAATSTAGVTLGVELPTAATLLRLAVRGQYGTFNTGTTSSTGMGVSLVCAIAARRETR